MLIARVKKESNIVEYVLYMYQIEDLIRSFQFDLERIDRELVQSYEQTEKIKTEIKAWYSDLIEKMKSQNIQQEGHLQELNEVVEGIEVLHQSLLNTFQDKNHIRIYEEAQEAIHELRQKTKAELRPSEVAVSINGLYGLLLLRLKNQAIAEETKNAMNSISNLMANLAFQYNQMKMGKLRFPEVQNN